MTLKELEMLIKCKQYVETEYKALIRQLEHMSEMGKNTIYVQAKIAAIENILNTKQKGRKLL